MELIWCGTASLILREQNTVIAFDPFGKLPVCGFSKKAHPILHEGEYREATDVFVTHGHFDHIYHIPQIYRDGNVRIYCTDAPMHTLEKHGIPDMEIVRIAPGWSGAVGPFQITAYQGRHCKFDLPMVFDILRRPMAWRHFFYSVHLGTMSLEYPENREILFYEVSVPREMSGKNLKLNEMVEEGFEKRPVRMREEESKPESKEGSKPELKKPESKEGSKSDSKKPESKEESKPDPKEESKSDSREISGPMTGEAVRGSKEKETRFRIQIMGSMNLDPDVTYPTGADILILPLQGRSDQDEYALQFVERLRPKQVLLDHYDDAFPPISQDVDVSGFVKNVEERLHIPCRPMKEGEVFSPEKETLSFV